MHPNFSLTGMPFFAVILSGWWFFGNNFEEIKPPPSTCFAEQTSQNSVCEPPFALQTLLVTDSSALISWLSPNIPNETLWDLELVRANEPFSGIPTHPAVADKPFFITGLASGETYQFKIRAICNGQTSAWSHTFGQFFTTILNGQCSLNLPIPDNGCPNSAVFGLKVENAQGTALGQDLILNEVRLILEHDWLIDLEIQLRSPSGRIAALVMDNGGTNNHFGDPSDSTCQRFMTLLNANACGEQSIADANAPFTGRYVSLGNLNFFNDGSNPNGEWQLLVCDDAPSNVGILKFVELVFSPVTCAPPSELEVIQVDSTFVTLDWTPGGRCDSAVIEYGFKGFAKGAGIFENAGCPPFTLSGLVGGSEYDFYIFEKCENGIRSNYACFPASAKTLCTPPPKTIFENFDALPSAINFSCGAEYDFDAEFWRNAKNDNLDWFVNAGETPTGLTGPTDDVTGGGKYIYLEASAAFGSIACSPGSEAVLMSNCFLVDTRNTDSCHLSFSYHMYGRNVDQLRLDLTSDGISWNTIWSKTGNQGELWLTQKISLSQYQGQVVQVRFVGKRGGGDRGDMALDEIAFFGSQNLSEPGFRFYIDSDGDGYGNPDRFLASCFDVLPGGYVRNDLDCNDRIAAVNLVRNEIPCNGIDENCNGMFDDFWLPQMQGQTVVVCNGGTASLTAMPVHGGDIIWFDSLQNYIQEGATLTLNDLENFSSQPYSLTYYASEFSGFCFSVESAKFTVIVNPNPVLSTDASPILCAGESLDLRNIPVFDSNNSKGLITYHTGFPATTANQLLSPIIQPATNSTIIIKSVANGGCTDTARLDINVHDSPIAEITLGQDSVFLCKGNSVNLTGHISGGVQPYTAIWSTLETELSILVTANLSNERKLIRFTATDANQCTGSDSVWVNTSNQVTALKSTTTDVTVCNGNNGSLLLEPIGGQPPFSYFWEGPVSGNARNVMGSYNVGGLEQGSYSVTVLDNSPAQCPFVRPFIVINGPAARVFVDSISDVSCFGKEDGAIFLHVTGNNPAIQWNIGDRSEDIENLGAGSYSVTVSDGDCQSRIQGIVVNEPDSLYALTLAEDVRCHGDTEGKIQTQVFGGTAPFQFSWNNNSNDQNQENLPAGSYNFQLTDSNRCTFFSNQIRVDEPTFLDVQSMVSNPLCFGREDGEIQITTIGGTPPYFYHWEDNSNYPDRVRLIADSYHLTVNDANGCQKILNDIQVLDPAPIEIIAVNQINPLCSGVDDGSISVMATGGTGNLVYHWNTNQNGNAITGLSDGKYWLTISDANGCSLVSDTFEIISTPNLSVQFDLQLPTCQGRSDGKILPIVVSGGQQPFSFRWSNGTVSKELEGIGAGIYSLTIVDDFGCISTFENLQITAPQILSDRFLVTNDPKCFGDSNGSIYSNIVGGSLPYHFEWNNGAITQNLQNLPTGNYQLTVTDRQGCRLVTDEILLTTPSKLKANLLEIDPIRCHGDSSGSIIVEATGGEAPYQFLWNLGVYNGDLITSLPAGGYELMVVDARGCTYTHPVITLREPPALLVDYSVKAKGRCIRELLLDTIFTSVAGGVPPYSYSWSNHTNAPVLTGIGPGEYALTVTDNSGCSMVTEKIKVQNTSTEFFVKTAFKTDISCNGSQDGTIRVEINGGRPPYQYLWSAGSGSGGRTDSLFFESENLESGIYQLTVVDANGCKIQSDKFEIKEPSHLLLNVTALDMKDVSCFGGRDGRINLNISGGNYPFDVKWYDQNHNLIYDGQSPIGLPKGIYHVIVTDQNGCADTLEQLKIAQPDSFFIRKPLVTDAKCFGDSTGTITVSAVGGTFPYSFHWSNNQTGAHLSGLPVGNYRVSVVDGHRCVVEQTIAIKEPLAPLEFENFQITDPTCHGEDNGVITFAVIGGTPAYRYFIDDFPVNGSPLGSLGEGNYRIFVLDNNACPLEQTVELTAPEPIEIAFTIKNATPGIFTDGAATAIISGGTPPYRLLWNTGDTTAIIINKPAGRYFLTALDAKNCEFTAMVEIKLSTGTDEIGLNNFVQIFPNPATEFVGLNFDLPQPLDLTLEIVNSAGQIIEIETLKNVRKGAFRLNLISWPSGVYFFKLRAPGKAEYQWRVLKVE